MPSYQDIETRLQVVEEKLDFVMLALGRQKLERLPTLDAQGQPMVRVINQTFLDLYREKKNAFLSALAAETARRHEADRGTGGPGVETPAGTPELAGGDAIDAPTVERS